MQSSSAPLTVCRFGTWLYVGGLVLVGGVALAAFCASLLRIATEVSRVALTPLSF